MREETKRQFDRQLDRRFDWPDKPKCDFCNLPATEGIRDTYEYDPEYLARSGDPDMHIRKFYPGPWRFVCDSHKVSLTGRISLPHEIS